MRSLLRRPASAWPIHRETRILPGYVLVVAKGGLKLKPSAPGEQQIDSWGWRVRTISAQKASMSALADEMTDSLGQVVIDKTGLRDVYDFELRWLATIPAAMPPTQPPPCSLCSTPWVSACSGRSSPTETIVVDRMERTPTEINPKLKHLANPIFRHPAGTAGSPPRRLPLPQTHAAVSSGVTPPNASTGTPRTALQTFCSTSMVSPSRTTRPSTRFSNTRSKQNQIHSCIASSLGLGDRMA